MQHIESKPKNAFHTSTKNNELSRTVMNLAKFCVQDKKITILLTDAMEEDLFAPNLSRNNFALMSFFGNEVLQKHKRLRDVYILDDDNVGQKVYPVTTAIVTVSRADRLEKILEDLKDSIWWNHEAKFIIVNSDGVDNCQMAHTFLTITWKYNSMYVLYLCTSSKGYDRFGGIEFDIICTALSHLNASLTVKFSGVSSLMDDEHKLHGMAKDVIQGSVDLGMHEYILRDFWKVQAHSFDAAFLKFVSGIIPVSHTSGLASALTFKVSISLLIIYVVLVQALRYILKLSASSAALEFVRIFSQSSTIEQPSTLIPRVLLIFFIVATFTFSSYVQSLLKAISTTDDQFYTIDTVDDLINCRLPIFVTTSHRKLASLQSVSPERFNIVSDIESCFEKLVKDNLVERSNTYIFSDDSPLLWKFNDILLKMSEGGFVALFYDREKENKRIKAGNDTEKKDMNLVCCCLNEKKITILLIDEMDEDFFVPNLSRNNFAFISFFGNEVLQKHKRLRDVYVLDDVNVRQVVYPVTTAIVAVSRANRLEKILEDLKNSIWWNHEANFIIVNSDDINSCQMARTFLTITWTYKMMYVLYLCMSSKGILLYTFNPFTDSAPNGWIKIQNESLNNYWTLYENSLDAITQYSRLNANATLSSELFFDRIKKFNGYNVKVVFKLWGNKISRYDKSKPGYERYDGIPFKVICTVLSHLNATLTAKFSSIPNLLVNKKLYGMASDVIKGPVDILINEYILRDFWKVQAHSFATMALKFVSYKIQILHTDGLASVFTFRLCIFLLIMYIVFVQMLRYVLKVSTSSAALEFVRIFIQSSTLKQPSTLIPRVLLIFFIVATFTFSSYVQSLLKAISTTDNQFSTIDTVDDLLKCRGTPIFTSKNLKELLNSLEIDKRINALDDIKTCFDWLRKGDRVVCLQEERFVRYYLPKSHSIHISTDNLVEKSSGYVFSEDSPLLKKFNHILVKMNEAGFIKYFYSQEGHLQDLKEKHVEKTDSSSTLDLVYLSPVFYILAASWFLGIIIFSFELLIPKIAKFM
ncbi:hypothetical protein TSAR_005157 [Trichomalopsis sarcophagae]|uniref:Ionotropic glutamate receptor C-terminal domain-containing protein n=1 Tax=Trichomalopsis sarcophagae TaxID=543379 RepID=A0A232F809_9HYME|nr:hypothetical protein TSAR_005157 [Trichomalopsis sarcophagae]